MSIRKRGRAHRKGSTAECTCIHSLRVPAETRPYASTAWSASGVDPGVFRTRPDRRDRASASAESFRIVLRRDVVPACDVDILAIAGKDVVVTVPVASVCGADVHL